MGTGGGAGGGCCAGCDCPGRVPLPVLPAANYSQGGPITHSEAPYAPQMLAGTPFAEAAPQVAPAVVAYVHPELQVYGGPVFQNPYAWYSPEGQAWAYQQDPSVPQVQDDPTIVAPPRAPRRPMGF
jgi:hypothetical protein